MWHDKLHHLQAVTEGYSGALALPAAQVGKTTARELTELPLTLPELVDKYRDFAARAALWWRQPDPTNGRF